MKLCDVAQKLIRVLWRRNGAFYIETGDFVNLVKNNRGSGLSTKTNLHPLSTNS